MAEQLFRVTVWPFLSGQLSSAPAFAGRENKEAVAERIYTAITFANAKGLAEINAPSYLISLDKLVGGEWVRQKSRGLRPAVYQ